MTRRWDGSSGRTTRTREAPTLTLPHEGREELLDGLHQQDDTAASVEPAHGGALNPAGEALPAPVGRLHRQLLEPVAAVEAFLDRVRQFGQRQADIESEQ